MRRLSAIMFTDMVGFSALTQSNEALALDLLAEHRTILRPFFSKHDGREIETAGDSFFVEFNSAVEATNCAIEIQTSLHERNKTEAADHRILLRIGIHIGDVVYVDKHVHGDGVNIAARLEPKAQPGGICISEDVARQIRNKVEYPIVKQGEEKLKNISMPMEIYCIQLPWLIAGHKTKSKFAGKKIGTYALAISVAVMLIVYFLFLKNNDATASSSTKFRIAVLPLKNISNNSADDYFADGLTEELISGLSKINGLNVIARTSIMKYKMTDKDVRQIGRELSVGAVLEGSVRKIDNKARITVQLIDVSNEQNLWSMDYDRELSDIFTIQSEIASNVAKELKVRLVESNKPQSDNSTTSNVIAYQEYLIGKHFLNQRTSESIRNALGHFEKSIELDPQFVLPYPSLAYCYTLIGVAGYGGIERETAELKAKAAVMKALDLDSNLAEAHAALGYIHFRTNWNWSGAEYELKKAIELKPGYATAHEWYGLFLATQARLEESLHEMKTALELDPLSPNVNTGLSRIYHFRKDYDKAIEQINKTLVMEPGYAEAHFTAGMTHLKAGNYDDAEIQLSKAVELANRRPVMLGMLASAYIKNGKDEEARKIVAELEKPPMNNDKLFALVPIKNLSGEKEEGFHILEKLVDERYGILVYMNVERGFFTDGHSPRYIALLKKMGFENAK